MIIKTSDFYKGKIPEIFFDITFFEKNNDYIESNIDITYRIMYGDFKIEVSFFKKTGYIHYMQIEELGDGGKEGIVILDDIEIFNKKTEKDIFKKNGNPGCDIRLYFYDNRYLNNISYIPEFNQL